jgi:two-component system, LytTR family, sensor kinase
MSKIQKLHIRLWIIYTFYYMITYGLVYGQPLNVLLPANVIFINISFAVVFYGSSLLIFPKYLDRRKYFLAFISTLLLISIAVTLRILGFKYMFPLIFSNAENQEINFKEITLPFWNTQIYAFYALGYYFSQRVIQQQKEISQKDVEIANEKAIVAEQQVVLIKKEKELAEEKEKNAILAKEKAQAEMAFLRAQINPHFLFNTLNLIYSKVITSTKEIAGETIIDFAEMMKYATSTKMQEDTVDVSGELDFVRRYIKLFKARNSQGVYIDFEEEGYFGSHRVVPMVLITMVENALKHGLIDDPSNPVIIRASLIDDFFVFMVHNTKNLYPNDIAGKGNTGVGVPNIIKRLNAVYKKGGFTLESEDLKDDYIVTFTVNYKII